MDQPSHDKIDESVLSDPPATYTTAVYQPVVMESGVPLTGDAFPPGSQGPSVYPVMPAQLSDQQQFAFQQAQNLHHQQQQFQALWADQMAEIGQTTQFKVHSLPLARIKKIMKADEDVQMIAGEAPAVFAKACEMFILELTMRGWFHAEEHKRRTLLKNDITAVINRTDNYDFLLDVTPNEELKEDCSMGVSKTVLQTVVPHYSPGMAFPLGLYPNQQPATYIWPQLDQQQQQQQPGCDGGQDE